MRKYEVMLILSPDADDSVVGGAIDRIGRIVQEGGGSVAKIDKWGKRRLAYEILRQSEGFYVVVDCVGQPDVMVELDRVLSLADEVMRFKIVARGEADGQVAAGAPSAPAAVAKPATRETEPTEEAGAAADEVAGGASPDEPAGGGADAADEPPGGGAIGGADATDEPAAGEASAP